MPTGYTYAVGEGTVSDFRPFALRCARQFGATVMQRDEDGDVPPRLREPSLYYGAERRKAEARIAELAAMTPADAERAAHADYERQVAAREEYLARSRQTRARYEAMLAQVRGWQAPTKEHEGLRRFMISQLEESIAFDCNESYFKTIQRLDGPAWLIRERKQAAKDLAHFTTQEEEDAERVAVSNAWITALYESLGAEAPA